MALDYHLCCIGKQLLKILEKNYMKSNFIKCPLNYIGGKIKLLPQILPLFPQNIDTFVDLFCGGANVCVNVNAERKIANDNNTNVIGFVTSKMYMFFPPLYFLYRLYIKYCKKFVEVGYENENFLFLFALSLNFSIVFLIFLIYNLKFEYMSICYFL